ncbi:MAG TPA: glycoside hydrolase family 3 C-terminal domain-containing protein, partial [Longimicrobiales bacterium]
GARTNVLYARGSELADNFASFDVVPASMLFGPGGEQDLRVAYFSNRGLTGRPLFTGRDSTLDRDWRARAPRAGMDADDFGVRWSGVLKPTQTGSYQIGLIGTMKFELYLDDSLMVRSVYSYRDEFGDPRLRATAPLQLQAGKAYRLRVETHESYGDAQIQLVWSGPHRDLTPAAVAAAQKADAVVLFLGLTPRLEGEEMDVAIEGFRGGDRTSIDLPAAQQRLLEKVVAVGRPTVLVLMSGSALAVNWAHDHVPAILEAWYPGQAAGSAIADVLFGDYNPGGRLPVTFYRSVNDLPAFSDYAMHGRTYRFFTGKPLYPFGHGASYTTFAYSDLAFSNKRLSPAGETTVSVAVRNSGQRAGDEVVQLYVQHLGSAVERPLQELKDYRRVTLQPDETRKVTFTLKASQLAYWDSTAHKWTVENDRVRVMVGASSGDIRLTDTLDVGSDNNDEPALRLSNIFSDRAVLQRNAPLPVWGWSTPGSGVSVTLAGRTMRTTAAADGRWAVQLPALPAGGRHQLVVESGSERITRNDLTVGDVWVASGQSNMEWPLDRALNGAAAVTSANDLELREFFVPHTWSDTVVRDLPAGSWQQADPQHAGSFSAVGYFFARELRASQEVPIGIIHTSWGGSNVETWISRAAQGITDAAMQNLLRAEQQFYDRIRDTLRARLGDVPTTDEGMVDGRAPWADPSLNDSGWASLEVPGLWEQQGYDGLDGVAWYRTSFMLSAAEAGQPARLSLGPIDDDEITWINGSEVGRTSGYTRLRSYDIPAGVLRTGRNVLALRVADGGGGGGPWGDASQYYLQVGAARRSLAGAWKFKVGAVSLGPNGQRINKIPSVLYNAMIHPLLRFPIKGVIWYQGESNANNDEQAAAYRPLFAKLIESW